MPQWKSDSLVLLRVRESRTNGEAAKQMKADLGKHYLHPRRQETDVNTTESDSEESKVRSKGAVYLIGAPVDAGIPQRNMGKDEPESGRRSRWAERRGVWKRARNANRSDLQTAKGRQLSGTAGSPGRYTQRTGQSRAKAARNSDGRGQAVATGGSAHSGGGIRSRFPRLQSWLQAWPKSTSRAARVTGADRDQEGRAGVRSRHPQLFHTNKSSVATRDGGSSHSRPGDLETDRKMAQRWCYARRCCRLRRGRDTTGRFAYPSYTIDNFDLERR